MSTVYVQRDGGAIVGVFTVAQPGFAVEAIDDQSADVQAFLTPPPSPQEVLAGKLALGIAITSTSTPALNATYALDQDSTNQIFQIGTYCGTFSIFPTGGTTFDYPDANYPLNGGSLHTFTVAAFVNFLKAVAPLVSALTLQGSILAAGGSPNWPAQSATIA